MIKLSIVTKRFRGTVAVNEVTLQVIPGDRVAICGHSGCGKTTLLRLIAGFERPDGGEILLDGRLVSTSNLVVPPAKRQLAMVFQDPTLWPHLTVEQHINFGLESIIPDAEQRRHDVSKLLRTLRLEGRESAYPSQLSGGEQQRVALGRAIARRPAILLLDEPLAHVDDELRDVLAEFLLSVQSRNGMTLVYATHDRQLAARLANRTIRMSKGHIEGAA